MSKVEASSIPAILDAIVGITSANGDTYLDDESMRNVDKLKAVCGWVCDRIYQAYSGDYPKQCASAKKVVRAVRMASEFILDYMGVCSAERTCSLEYDTVHHDYVCTKCGERYDSGMYTSVSDDDKFLLKPMKFCTNCGAKVVDNGA